ncbi:hypothetical protein IV102_07640 [bacterium]|nr:hypothetical protein [bacterium]
MRRSFCWLLLSASLAAQPENPYPKDIAARYLPVTEASSHTKDGSALELVTPVNVIKARSVPFQAVGLAPQKVTPVRPKTWDLPPFATIGPPQVGPEPEVEPPREVPPAFSEVELGSESPSSQLRPKAGPRKLQARFKDYAIPEPISRVCYGSNSDGICQFSLYGGTNSFAAEDAYFSLNAALDSREELKGFGKVAVLGVFREAIPKKPTLAERRFDSIEVAGKARPDLVDPGLNQARKAPAFKEISTHTLSGGRLDMSRLPPPVTSSTPRAPRNYWVFLAYYPDKAVTAEILLDQRLGNPQNLVDMASLIHAQIKNR